MSSGSLPTTPSDAGHLIYPKPPGKMTNPELLTFVRSRAYSSSPLYADDFSRCRKAELYDQGDQWVQRARGTSDSRYPSQWRRIEYSSNDANAIPLPVHNEGVLLRENESARLGRPEYKPRVKPSGPNPGITEKDGAKGAERALQSRIKAMWGNEEDNLYLHMPLYGGAWLKSYWDQTWMETVRVPAPSLCCPRKQGQQQPQGQPGMQPGVQPGGEMEDNIEGGPLGEMAEGEGPEMEGTGEMGAAGMQPGIPTPSLPPPVAMPGADLLPDSYPSPPQSCTYCRKKEKEGEPVNSDNGLCPVCPDSPPLIPYTPTLDEALNSDLGTDLPRGDWYMRTLFPYQVFPRDAGVNLDPTDIEEWTEVFAVPLTWAESRWPDKIRDTTTGELRVHPQNPATIMSENPTLGSPDILQYAQHAGVFRSHVIVYEYNRKPWLEWDEERKVYAKNRGRTIVVVVGLGGSGVTCLDDHLMVESLNKPGTFVARTHLQYICWEKKDGGRRTTVGQSLWDRLFDPQDGINERMSQVRAVNQRSALPWYLQRSGINLETRSADSAVPMRRIIADIDPNEKNLPLILLNNEVINPGVYEEVSYYSTYMGKNIVEVEKGQVPPGVAAATAIAYLKTESGEKRRPRILRIRRAYTRAWEHGLQLMAALYIEPRPYTFEDEEDNEEKEAFITGDVVAQSNPRVDIYPTPDYDITDARRESIRDQVQLGILNPTQTPQLARKISAAMDESLEFFMDDDLQEQQAQREWRDFKESQLVPVVDPSLDDDLTHYQEHGRSCFSEWFREREKEAEWDKALDILGVSWDEDMQRVLQIAVGPMLGMGPMGGAPPQPQPGAEQGAETAAAGPGMAPPPSPAAPAPPPMPLPSLQSLISRLWELKLQQAASIPATPRNPTPFSPNPTLLSIVIPWRAHMEAHKLKVELKQMKERMMAAPTAPEPGKGSSPTSTDEAAVDGGVAVRPPGA